MGNILSGKEDLWRFGTGPTGPTSKGDGVRGIEEKTKEKDKTKNKYKRETATDKIVTKNLLAEK